MPIEHKQIVKKYLLLCEGRDAQEFLRYYLKSDELAQDQRFSNEIQILDFGGINDLKNYLLNLHNMDKFDQVTSLAVIRDAEKDYTRACQQVKNSFRKCGFVTSESSGKWVSNDKGQKTGFILFPLNNNAGTLEDLCLRILSEKDHESIQSSVDTFLAMMELSYGRNYRRKHKNKLHMYLSSTDEFVTMPIGVASQAGAFDWSSNELEPLKTFLAEGFSE